MHQRIVLVAMIVALAGCSAPAQVAEVPSTENKPAATTPTSTSQEQRVEDPNVPETTAFHHAAEANVTLPRTIFVGSPESPTLVYPSVPDGYRFPEFDLPTNATTLRIWVYYNGSKPPETPTAGGPVRPGIAMKFKTPVASTYQMPATYDCGSHCRTDVRYLLRIETIDRGKDPSLWEYGFYPILNGRNDVGSLEGLVHLVIEYEQTVGGGSPEAKA